MSRYNWLNEGPESAPITQGDLQQIENYADRLFAKVGIDVEFTQHFLDRVNDERNKKQINMAELTRLFKQEFKKYGKKIAQLGPGAEAVMKDMRTDVNMPFVLQWDKNNQELDLVAKTIMRKKNFRTPDPEFAVEGVGIITNQNATKDAPLGSEFANVEKLGLGKGQPKELYKKARKNSDPNKLFNLGLTENVHIKELLTTELQEVSMFNKFKQKMSPMIKPDLYAKAAEVLHKVLVRKSKEGKLRHSLPYYAMAVGRSFAGVDYRTLASYYQDHYDLESINELRYERKPKEDELMFGKGTKTKWKTDKTLPNLRIPTKATKTDRIRAMQAIPESEEALEEGWAQTLSNLVLGSALTLGGLGALTVKQALDSPDFSKQEKVEIFTAANLPASQLPKELQLPKQKPEIEYTPLTNTTNEKTLARVAKQNGIKGLELAAFMSQMAHESEDFTDMVEDNPNIKKYAGRLAKALGNKNANDAERFIGRGFIQLTGRWNYEWMQKSLGVDLTSSWSKAHQASDPKIAAKIAVEFWKQRVRPKVDDFADVAAVTKPINSKLHGLKHREARFTKMAQAMNELKIVKPDTKDTLGVTRAEMPQVASEHYPELFDYFKANGANFKMQTVPANSLKAIQGEFSDAGVVKSLNKGLDGEDKKPVIASIDDYIIDGHHRWLAALNTDSEAQIDIIKVNKTGKDLLQLVIDFPKTTYKDIYN